MRSRIILMSMPMVVVTVEAQPVYEDIKLVAADSTAGATFGISVGVSGARTVVGAPGVQDQGARYGAAYLYDTGSGSLLLRLVPDEPMAGEEFGRRVAISNDVVVVGAYANSLNGFEAGAAYLFDAKTGVQTARLIPEDIVAGDRFGWAVAVSGDHVIVGAYQHGETGASSGAAYVFDVRTGKQVAKLIPSDIAAGDQFGEAVAIDGGLVVVTSRSDDDRGMDSGSAYVFDLSTGEQVTKLLAADGAESDFFGEDVAIADGTVIVGAYDDDDAGPGSGSAYVFDAVTGVQRFKLLAQDGQSVDNFGTFVAISGHLAVVSSYLDDDSGSQSGSAYAFDVRSGRELGKLLAHDGAAGDYFGWGVSVSHGSVVIGAHRDDDHGSRSGSAYVFRLDPPCLSDFSEPFGVLDGVDVAGYVDKYLALDPSADLAGPFGVWNFFDMAAFLAAYNAGCP